MKESIYQKQVKYREAIKRREKGNRINYKHKARD